MFPRVLSAGEALALVNKKRSYMKQRSLEGDPFGLKSSKSIHLQRFFCYRSADLGLLSILISIRSRIKRLICAVFGSGPWRIAPFDTISKWRTDYAGGVHRPEDFTGVLFENALEPTYYSPGVSLIGQGLEWEVLPRGIRYIESGLSPASPIRAYSLSKAGVIGSDGIIYCLETRRAVAEALRSWVTPIKQHPALGAPRYPAAIRLPGLTLSLLTLSGDGFYHHLLESIPRLSLLRRWLELADHVLSVGSPDSLQARWLAYAGVPVEKIVWMEGLCHVACDQLLFTDYPMRDQVPSAWIVQAIRSSFPLPNPKLTTFGRRVWISRGDASSRILSWENDLLALLPDFSRVELAKLTPAQQISLAAEAEVIAGPHGAGLAHVLFGKPGGRVIELFPPTHLQPTYSRLAGLAGLRYAWAKVDYNKSPDLHALAHAIYSFCALPSS